MTVKRHIHRALLGAVIIALAGGVFVGTAQTGNSPLIPNIPFPTHGGKFVWQDVKIHADWRIQKNVVTGHYRLLDNHDLRRGWGNYDDMLSALNNYKKSEKLSPASTEMVMLIHGITPVVNPFEDIEPALKKLGYDAVKISYPSTLGSIEDHAKAIGRLIENLDGTTRIHFVTHSMGGLVLRHLLADKNTRAFKQQIGRIILIAPPNQGAAIARMLKDFAPFKALYGQAGQDLTPSRARHIPDLKHPFIIIAGGRGDDKGYNPLIDGDDDGTVGVAETRLKGAQHTYVIKGLHTQLGNSAQAVDIISKDINSAVKTDENSQ